MTEVRLLQKKINCNEVKSILLTWNDTVQEKYFSEKNSVNFVEARRTNLKFPFACKNLPAIILEYDLIRIRPEWDFQHQTFLKIP